MAKRKRKTSGRSTASRRKNRTQDRMPAGLITLFAGLVLMALAFVPGSSAWRTMHDVLFGVFGCGSFVLGAALCYLAILYTRGEDLLPHIAKLVLGLIFASGTVIVFSDIPTDQTAAQMTAACYHNGMSAWLSGGALGAVLGGTLLLLCGRPAANLVMAALAACASLYIFDVTPAECWQWLCNVGGSVHEKGLAVHEQNAARRAERLAERAAEEAAAEEYEDYDDDLPEDEVGEGEDYYGGEEPAAPAFHIQPPGWLAGVFHWGHQVMQGGEQAEPAPAPAPEAQTPPQPEPAPVQVEKSRPRAPFDIDLGPDHTTVTEGGSEPIEPIILGPGGTFGMDPLRRAPIRATVTPIVPDAVDTAAEDFFTAQPEPTVTPTVTPAAPAEEPEQQPAPEPPLSFGIPLYDLTPTPEPAPQPVSAENAVAFRSEPDEDGWISITSDPVEEKDLNTLVAAAMEKPATTTAAAKNQFVYLLFFIFSSIKLITEFRTYIYVYRVFHQIRIEHHVFCRERQCKAGDCHIRRLCIRIVTGLVRIHRPTAVFIISLISSTQTIINITALCLQLIDSTLGIIICQTYIIIPTVAFASQFQPAFLPDVLPSNGGFRSNSRNGTATYCIESIQCTLVCSRGSQSHFRLGIYQIDIGQAQDMGCQAAVHITSRYAQAQYMVIIVTIEMLHVIGTGRRLVIAIRSSLTIFGIINKPQIIKSALVLPEIIVYITCHHHSSLTTGIRIRTRLRTFQSGNSKCILQINRRTCIATPAITKFIESHHCQVRLQRILLCPGVTSCRPVPGEETLFILVVCQTENIGIVSQQVTAGIINYILGIFCRFRQIIRIAGTGKATLS